MATKPLHLAQQAINFLRDCIDSQDHFTDLPSEMIGEIFSHLHGKDIKDFEQACKTFYQVSRKRFTHSPICLAYHSIGHRMEPAIQGLVQDAGKPHVEIPVADIYLPLVVFQNALWQPIAETRFYQSRIKEIYPLFKQAIAEIGIAPHSDPFCLYASCVQDRIFTLLKAETLPLDAPLFYRIKILIKEFQKATLAEISRTYASQPLETITVASYKQKLVWLHPLLTTLSAVDIESSLRQAIFEKHGPEKLRELSLLFEENTVDSPLYLCTKETMKAELQDEANTLIQYLDGLSPFQTEEKRETKTRLDQIVVVFEQPGGLDLMTRIEMSKRSSFYRELAHEIREHNKDLRFRKIHKIID